MTMIAAFRSLGMPALIGDFMVTREGAEAGTMKKIVILHPQLAVGYSGKDISITQAMRALSAWASSNTISKATLQGFLVSEEMAHYGDGSLFFCNLVGWVVDSDGSSHCFCWWSNYPSEVYYDEPIYQGSGGPDAKSLLVDGPKGPSDDEDLKRICVFNAAMCLMKEELAPSGKQRDAYGYAFEAIVLQDGQFEYITNAAVHYQVVCSFSSDGKLNDVKLNPHVILIRNRDNFTEVTRLRFDQLDAQVNLISSAITTKEDKAKESRALEERLSHRLDPSYSVGLEWIKFIYPGVEIPEIYFTRYKEQHALKLDGEVEYVYQPDFLEACLRDILADLGVALAPKPV